MAIKKIFESAEKDNNNHICAIKVYTTTIDLANPEQGSVDFLIKINFKDYKISVCVNDFNMKFMHNFIKAFLSNSEFREQFRENQQKYLRHATIKLNIDGINTDIDENIAPAIEKLNQIGAKTQHCCQGGDKNSAAYISLKSGEFPKELISAWKGANFHVSEKIVRATCPFGMKKEAGILFQKSLQDWINNNLDTSGNKYKIIKKRPNSLPKIPNPKSKEKSK